MPRSPRLLVRRARLVLPLTVLLGALVAWAGSPATAAAATTTIKATACSAVNVRTSPSTTATRKVSLGAGVTVSVTAAVKGAKWTATCAGKTVSSTTWYRITSIGGTSVKAKYGTTYLYAASGLFKSATMPRVTACGSINLRTAPRPTATRKATLASGATISAVGTVDGTTFKTTCGGRTATTSRWYRISAVGGRSVKSRYGVTYLYAPIVVFKAPPVPAETPGPSPTPGGLTEGIDVSHWQGSIDWPTVAAAGKKFVFMKATESTDFVDPNYTANEAGAKAAGLLVGAYHYADPDTTPGDGAAEADHFLSIAPLSSGDLIPVLDLEVTGGLSATALQGWVRDYLGRIYEQTGVHGMIYMSPAFWRNKMADTTWFADNGYSVLWIAHWTTAGQPDVPANAWDGNGWTFWQYTSSGSVPGISGRVDLDRFNGTDLSAVRIP